MRIVECEQGTPEWHAARTGRITASCMSNVLNFTQKGTEGADRVSYRTALIAERLTGISDDSAFQTKWLKEGKENEPLARTAYELETGNFVDQVGFVLHPSLDCAGTSPDGLYGSDGGVEIKCGKSTTHIKWMMAGMVPKEHVAQMQWTMACCERSWLDFVSFDPRMPDDLKLFIVRLERDDKEIAEMEAEVIKFDSEINATIERLRLCAR